MNLPVSRRAVVPTILSVSLCASLALAQRPDDLVRPAPQESRQLQVPAPPALDLGRTSWRALHDRLCLSRQPDGSPQVRARSYKAEFAPHGATYIPFCGSDAPASHPLTFRIESIAAGGEPVEFADSVVAGLDGEIVRYERGGVTELYELALDSVEQEFVFDSLPASGELVLRLALATDMTVAREGDELLFSSADGAVRYGAAVVVDAAGASAALSTELDGQALVLRVPAEFLARASFPITIDPVITNFTVTSAPVHSFAPAVSWDQTNQRYCVVYEETFSATDHDVVFAFINSSGVWEIDSYVDAFLGQYWANPDVANNNYSHSFYIVCEVGLPTGGARTIHGRTVDGFTGLLGADTLVSTADQLGEKINPSVGGDPFYASWTDFMVVWQRVLSAGVNEDVHGRLVSAAGVLQGASTILIDNSSATIDRNPRISKSCQASGLYHVVWERQVFATDRDIWAAEVNYVGTVTLGPVALVISGDTTAPACSSMNLAGQWMVVFEYDFGTDHDIFAMLVGGVSPGIATNLSWREDELGTGQLLRNQISPAVETDGVHFAYSCAEQFGTSPINYDTYVSSVDIMGNYLALGELHQLLGSGSTREDVPRMVSQQSSGGVGNAMGIVWQSAGVGIGDVFGAIYATGDFTKLCSPFRDGVILCPCGNTPTLAGRGCDNSSATGGASLNGSGSASLVSDTALLSTSGEKPTAASVVMQGSALINNGAAFGQGVRCAGGVLKRLYLKVASGGSISVPVGSDPTLHARSAAMGDPLSPGSTRYYFVYYRDPTILGGCAASLGYNATDTLQVVWRP